MEVDVCIVQDEEQPELERRVADRLAEICHLPDDEYAKERDALTMELLLARIERDGVIS